MLLIQVQVADLKRGDTFDNDGIGWTAITDAEMVLNGGAVYIEVEHHPDGGHGSRVWEDPGHKLTVTRAS